MAMETPGWEQVDSEWLRDEMRSIPDYHTWELELSFHKSFEEFRYEKFRTRSKDARLDITSLGGMYRWHEKHILLRDGFGPGLLSHEIGHHYLLIHDEGIRFWDVAMRAYQKYLSLSTFPVKMLEKGGDWSEFFADTYMFFAAENQDYWKIDRKPRILPRKAYSEVMAWYEIEFPKLTKWYRWVFDDV